MRQQLNKIFSIKYVVMISIFSSLSVVFLSTIDAFAVDYGAIPGGLGRAQELDTGCYNNYWNARNNGADTLKRATNASAYNGFDWVSSAANTGQTTVTVEAGSTDDIQLKINHLDYICYVATAPGTNNLGDVDARMRSPAARSGIDVAPAPWIGFQNSPNRTFYGFGLYGLEASRGSIVSYQNGAQVVAARNDSTRFWHVTSEFTYRPPAGGFTESQDVTITAKIRNVQQYYYRNNPRLSWEITCSGGKWNDSGYGVYPDNHSSLPDRWFTDQCTDETALLTFRVNVPFNYELKPYVTRSAATVVQGGDVSFEHSVVKQGTTDTRSTAYAVRQIVIAPGGSFNYDVGILDDAYKGNDSCDARYQGGSDCRAPALTTGSRAFNDATTYLDTPDNVETINTSTYPVGTVICRILAIHPPTHSEAPGHRWSAPACVTVVKKPFVSIINGDGWAGGSFVNAQGLCPVGDALGFVGTTSTYKDNKVYGSYGEYGIFSLNPIKTFGSAGKPIGSNLTFRNRPNPLGEFSTRDNHCLGDAFAYYGTKDVKDTLLAGKNSINVQTDPYGVVRKTGSDTLSLVTSGGFIPQNKHIVIIAEGDIHIDSNIVFSPGPYTSIDAIPSLVVISTKGNIIVSQSVTNIDGVYQANKRFISCREGERPGGIGINDGICQNQLTVHGAVIASQIITRRIHGSSIVGGDDQRKLPAENFIMRPDIFLSEYGQSVKSLQLRTVDEKELPPRY